MLDKSQNVSKGKVAETIAFDFLVAKGYQIVELNWRFKRAEIDIIAKDEEFLVFVEVKSRSKSDFGQPELGVTQKKKSMLVAGATSYMDYIDYDKDFRFDIISIILESEKMLSLDHYEDAFFPGL